MNFSWDGYLRSIEELGNRPAMGVRLYEACLGQREGHTPRTSQGRLSLHPNVIDRSSEFQVYRVHHLWLQVRTTEESVKPHTQNRMPGIYRVHKNEEVMESKSHAYSTNLELHCLFEMEIDKAFSIVVTL